MTQPSSQNMRNTLGLSLTTWGGGGDKVYPLTKKNSKIPFKMRFFRPDPHVKSRKGVLRVFQAKKIFYPLKKKIIFFFLDQLFFRKIVTLTSGPKNSNFRSEIEKSSPTAFVGLGLLYNISKSQPNRPRNGEVTAV